MAGNTGSSKWQATNLSRSTKALRQLKNGTPEWIRLFNH